MANGGRSPARQARTETWVEVATRDRELEAILDAALVAKAEQAEFPQLLAYGATLEIDDAEADEVRKLKPYARGAGPRRDGLACIRPRPTFDLSQYEYQLESLEPGDDWPESLQAKCWLLIAQAYADRYSDSLLNLTARALENAAAWYEVHEPAKAASMLAWRARVLGYASYGEDAILPVVDRACALLARANTTPEEEYGVIVQLCEAILRVRTDSQTPHTRELIELGIRGLELANRVASPHQRSGLYDAIAHALTYRADAEPLDVASAMRVLGAGADPLALAEAAWQRALDLEDGMFYGEIRTDHVTSHKQAYQRGLAAIALRRGDVARALVLFDRDVERETIYEQLQRTKALMAMLRAADVPLAARGEVLAARLRADVLDAPELEDWNLEQATKYLDYAIYHLWNLGQREATRELVDAIRARQGFAEAARARAEADASTRQELDGHVNDLMRSFVTADDSASALEPPSPEELAAEAAERAERLVNESPTERVERVLDEVTTKWLRDTRTLLLFTVKVDVLDASRAQLDLVANVPEFALETVLGDPLIARAVGELDARLHAALESTRVERRGSAQALDLGNPPDPSLTFALSVARARAALATLQLHPVDGAEQIAIDDARIEAAVAQQKRRRIELMWS